MTEKKEPILTFFYNKKNNVSKTITIDGLSIYSYQYPVYSDYKQTNFLGYVVNHGNQSEINNFISYSDVSVLSFDKTKDSISYEVTGGGDADPNDQPFWSPNQTIFNRIIGGKGPYTFLQGYVVVNTVENGDRICYVYSTN